MTVIDSSGLPAAQLRHLSFSWRAIFAGAIAAAAVAFVLESFGVAIGLSLSSTAPAWRDTSFALVLLSGLYLLLVAVVSYGLGGYISGRMSTPSSMEITSIEFADGMQGLLTWALATLIAALLALATLQSLTKSASSVQPTATGENIVAFDLDRLFRGGERQAAGNITYDRAEAARILLTTSSHNGMDQSDRAYLVRLIGSVTGLAPADAEHRVDEVAVHAKEDITRARRSAVILAFMTGAAALLGAATAWLAAQVAGEHRDGLRAVPIFWNWSNAGTYRHSASTPRTSARSTPLKCEGTQSPSLYP